MASKKVLDRQKSFALFEGAFEQGWPRVRASLEELLAGDLDGRDLDGRDLDGRDLDGRDLDGKDLDGKDLDGKDPGRLPRALLARLRRLLESLVDADGEVSRLQPVARSRRGALNRAADALRVELLEIKNPLLVAYGQRLSEVFLELTSHLLRRDRDRLLRIARFALDKLAHPDPDVPMIDYFSDVMPRPEEYEGLLREKLERYEEAYARDEAAQAELEAARILRNRLLEEYNGQFLEAAKVILGLFRFSGHPEWAQKLQPSGQEPGLLLSEIKKRRAVRASSKKLS